MKFNRHPTPTRGETKIVTKFALFPTKARNSAAKLNFIVWLETYRAVYRYEQVGVDFKYVLTDKLTN